MVSARLRLDALSVSQDSILMMVSAKVVALLYQAANNAALQTLAQCVHLDSSQLTMDAASAGEVRKTKTPTQILVLVNVQKDIT